mgnify:CR=1
MFAVQLNIAFGNSVSKPIDVTELTKFPTRPITYIFVRSRGREITKWHFFIPAVLEKMSLMQITYFAVTTAILLLIGYFGLQGK